jgi:hypothetical protein
MEVHGGQDPRRVRDGARTPAVSVVIPTHQRSGHVVAAVRSALQQQTAPKEVIVVDDGSTDGTKQALAAFGSQIRYLLQRQSGVAAARNAGVRAARGDVVAFLDDDDIWLKHHLSTVVDAFSRHPEAVLATTDPGFRGGWLMFGPRPNLIEPLPRLLIGNFVGDPSFIAARRDALLAAGGFDESAPPLCSGYDLWLRLGSLGPFVVVRRRTAVRTRLAGSLSTQGYRDGRRLQLLERRTCGRTAAELGLRSPVLSRAAESLRHFVVALRALDRNDATAASAALTDACRLMPERSHEPWLIGGWLGFVPRASTREGRLQAFALLAESWPDTQSDTALGLRLQAAVLALPCGRGRLALRLVKTPRGKPLLYGIRLIQTAIALRRSPG